MKASSAKQVVQQMLSHTGVRIDGDRPWDIRVYSPTFYNEILAGGPLALGESYVDGGWSCQELDQFFYRILRAGIDKKVRKEKRILWAALKAKIINAQSKSNAFMIGKRHYDISNHLFSIMLDKRMIYSCGYWDRAKTLDEAQEAKLDLICRKIGLKPGMTVLDIGCGWGGFARWAAERYNAKVLGITVSQEQVAFARQYCKELDVRIELKDYRDLNAQFDRIVSVGMFEHVGFRNYRTYMATVRRCLKKNGLFLLQTIGSNTSVKSTDPWIHKYIFPNSMLPSALQITNAIEGLLVLEDWHSFGQCYDKTLMAWYQNFTKGWDQIKHHYDDRFYRIWTYYLLSCAGSFRARRNQLWQGVFSKDGVEGGYRYRI